MSKTLMSLAFVLSLAAASALAQQQAPSAPEAGKVTFLSMQDETTWTATMLTGTNVTSPEGFAIGTVNDLLVRGDGTVSAVVINIGGVLGVGGKNVAVPYTALTPKPGKDGKPGFVLKVTKAEIDAAPAFKRLQPTMSEKAVKMMESAQKKMEQAAEEVGKSAKEMMDAGKKKMESDKQ